MEITKGYVHPPSTDAATPKTNTDQARPKDGPLGQNAPEAKSRGEAVVFGGSLANLDAASSTRDAERQSKVKRREAGRQQRAARHDIAHQRMVEHRQAAHQRMTERREAAQQRAAESPPPPRHEVDVSV